MKFLRFLNLNSIDVIIAALISYMAISDYLNSEVHMHILFVLGACVYLIYSFDKYYDQKYFKHNAPRHRSQIKNRKFILTWQVILASSSVVILYLFFSIEEIIHGLGIAILCVLYYLLQLIFNKLKKVNLLKELFISFIYTLCLWSFHETSIENLIFSFEFCLHFALVYLGVICISFKDYNFDKQRSASNVLNLLSYSKAKIATTGLFIIFGVALLLSLPLADSLLISYALIFLQLLFSFLFHERLRSIQFRTLIESSFYWFFLQFFIA